MTTLNFWEAIKSTNHNSTITPTRNLVGFGTVSVEATAEYDRDENRLYTFDQAQALVASKGLTLPTFHDVMANVIVPGLEGKLKGAQKAVFEDMFKSYGEWNDNAFYLDNDTLYVSTGISGIVWNQNAGEYDASNMHVSELPKAYNRNGLVSGWNPLKNVARTTPDLVVDLYGSDFNALPKHIKTNAGIYLPADKTVRPVGRVGDYDLGAGGLNWAVRGAQKNIPLETKVES